MRQNDSITVVQGGGGVNGVNSNARLNPIAQVASFVNLHYVKYGAMSLQASPAISVTICYFLIAKGRAQDTKDRP